MGLCIYLIKYPAKNRHNSQNLWLLAIERKALQWERGEEDHSEITVEMWLFKGVDNNIGLIISDGA